MHQGAVRQSLPRALRTSATTAQETSTTTAHALNHTPAANSVARHLRQRPNPSFDCRDRYPTRAWRESILRLCDSLAFVLRLSASCYPQSPPNPLIVNES